MGNCPKMGGGFDKLSLTDKCSAELMPESQPDSTSSGFYVGWKEDHVEPWSC